MKLNNKYKGFTLVELMIVVAIIGILASIALPAYQDYVARTQISEAIVLMNTQKVTIAEIATNDGDLSEADNDKQGIPSSININGKYTASVNITDGTMTAQMRTYGVSKGISNGTLTLTPSLASSGVLYWICGEVSDVALKYRPKSCR